jgi:hypothetical protein
MFASGMISKLARYIHQIEGLQISYSVYLTCSSLKHDTFYYPTMNLQQRAYINYAFPPSFSHISLPTQSFYSPTYNDVPTSHNAHCHFSRIQCTCTPTSTPTGSPGQARQALSCFPAPLGGVPPPPTALPSSAPGAPAPTLPGRPDLAPPGISRPPDSNSLPASPPPAVPISSAAGAPAPTLFGRPDLVACVLLLHRFCTRPCLCLPLVFHRLVRCLLSLLLLHFHLPLLVRLFLLLLEDHQYLLIQWLLIPHSLLHQALLRQRLRRHLL